MSANRMVRIPTIVPKELEICLKERKPFPTRWSESLYLEWFGANGRVLIEGAGFTCQLSAARWKLSEEAHCWNLRWKERECDDFQLDTIEDVGDEDSLPWKTRDWLTTWVQWIRTGSRQCAGNALNCAAKSASSLTNSRHPTAGRRRRRPWRRIHPPRAVPSLQGMLNRGLGPSALWL